MAVAPPAAKAPAAPEPAATEALGQNTGRLIIGVVLRCLREIASSSPEFVIWYMKMFRHCSRSGLPQRTPMPKWAARRGNFCSYSSPRAPLRR